MKTTTHPPPPAEAARPMTLATLRGIQHPPIPQPAPRPANMRKDEWYRRSAPPHSPLHEACARGTA